MDDINQILDPINQVTDTKKLLPKVIPFKCVNCNGYGTVRYGKQVCHSCKGRGYILVPQTEDGKDNTTA